MWFAMAGFVLMSLAGVTYYKKARVKMNFETWWIIHVYTYLAIAAAMAVQKELVKVLDQCQNEKGYLDSTGALVPCKFKTLSSVPESIMGVSNRVFVFTTIDSSVRVRAFLEFYQFNGDMSTGLYVMTTGCFSDAQAAKWLKVAVLFNQRLIM
jgi:hypothetical protein